MTWDLAQAKEDLGIPPEDTSKDAAITRQMNAVLVAAQTYCDRKFLFARETAYFPAPHGPVLSLPRYPLGMIYDISFAGLYTIGVLSPWTVSPQTGLITAAPDYSELCCWSGWHQNITVDYDGGYDELPADLEMALWEMFYVRWGASGGTGSMTDLGQAVTSSGIRSIAIPQVISMTMGGVNGSGGGSAVSIAGLPQAYASTLDAYRRLSA